MKKFLLSFFAVLVAVPVFAVEFTSGDFKANIYGKVFGDLFYTYSDTSDLTGNGALLYKDKSHYLGVPGYGSSRLGVTMSYNNVSGTVEFGVADPVRRAFLQYNINADDSHYVLIGRDSTIAAYSFGQVSMDGNSLNYFGTLADNRRFQLRYGIKGFELAVIMPNGVSNVGTDGGYALFIHGDETKKEPYKINSEKAFQSIPRVELAYTLSNDNLDFKVFGAYGAYLYQYVHVEGEEKKIYKYKNDTVAHSFNLGFGGQARFGESFLDFTGWYGMNLGLMSATSNANYLTIGTKQGNAAQKEYKINEVSAAGLAVGVGHTFADKYTLQAGVGYQADFGPGYKQMDDSLGAYLNCAIAINEWFSITPEVAYVSLMSDRNGNAEGYAVMAGVQALLVF